jgi:hypothetical protein
MTVWNAHGTGTKSVFGVYELQRCSKVGAGNDKVELALWSTAAKSEADALETQFLNAQLFTSVIATHS